MGARSSKSNAPSRPADPEAASTANPFVERVQRQQQQQQPDYLEPREVAAVGDGHYQVPSSLPSVPVAKKVEAVGGYSSLDGTQLSPYGTAKVATAPPKPPLPAAANRYDTVDLRDVPQRPASASRSRATTTYDEVEPPATMPRRRETSIFSESRPASQSEFDARRFSTGSNFSLFTPSAGMQPPPAMAPTPPARPSMSAGGGVSRAQANARAGGIEATVDKRIDKDKADDMLLRGGMRDGQYVIRESRSHPGSYVLCVAEHGQVRRYPLERTNDPPGYLLLSPDPPRFFPSIEAAIEYHSSCVQSLSVRLLHRLL